MLVRKCNRFSNDRIQESNANRTKEEFKLYQQNIEKNVNVDPSSFWKYVKAKSKQNDIPQVMNLGNSSFS